MACANNLRQENFWRNKSDCDDAERAYYQNLSRRKYSNELTDVADSHENYSISSVLSSIDAQWKHKIERLAKMQHEINKEIEVCFEKGYLTEDSNCEALLNSMQQSKSFSPRILNENRIQDKDATIAKNPEAVIELLTGSYLRGRKSLVEKEENKHLRKRLSGLEMENQGLKKVTEELKSLVINLENRLGNVDNGHPENTSISNETYLDVNDDCIDLLCDVSTNKEDVTEQKKAAVKHTKSYKVKKLHKPKRIVETSAMINNVTRWNAEGNMNDVQTRRKESYGIYIYRVLKQIHPSTGVTSKAMSIMNSFMNDIFERIASESSRLAQYNKKSTITPREIQAAIQLLFPKKLAETAILVCKANLTRYESSK